MSLNEDVPEKGTVLLSYHGRNHYNMLRRIDEEMNTSRPSAYEGADAADLPPFDDDDSDDSLSVGEPGSGDDGETQQAAHTPLPGTIERRDTNSLLPLLAKPVPDVDASRVNHAVRMSAIAQDVVEGTGRSLTSTSRRNSSASDARQPAPDVDITTSDHAQGHSEDDLPIEGE